MDDDWAGHNARDAGLARGELEQAWQDTLYADMRDRHLSDAVSRFAEDAGEHLDQLAADLAADRWHPNALTPVSIPKPDGQRELHIPTVRDRVVERCLLRRLVPLVEPELGTNSFGYRPGLGVADAVEAVCQLRDEGLGWVVRADIDECFASVDRSLLRSALGTWVPPMLMQLVELLLERPVAHGGRAPRIQPFGLPQGGLCAAAHNQPYEQRWVMRSGRGFRWWGRWSRPDAAHNPGAVTGW